MIGLAAEPSGMLQHLLVDRAIKIAIVVVALAVLAIGMRVIWRKTGRTEDRAD